ncbi:tetratricopeptide repeat protein [Streptomyces sp. NPDC060028]|uniref:tetratricopeptide repeat protein n=1 Tax=Streptomyces sp. NPDC060028 TaxID=3347041 RepID=UPI0036901CD1
MGRAQEAEPRLERPARRAGEAERWYRRAAEAGHLRATAALGVILYEDERAGEAEQFLRRAAEAGDAASMSNPGTLLYIAGRMPQAEQWYRRAVEAGFDRALHDLGVLLENTRGADEAEQWLRRAAVTSPPWSTWDSCSSTPAGRERPSSGTSAPRPRAA